MNYKREYMGASVHVFDTTQRVYHIEDVRVKDFWKFSSEGVSTRKWLFKKSSFKKLTIVQRKNQHTVYQGYNTEQK